MKVLLITFLLIFLFNSCESDSDSARESIDFSKVMMPDKLGEEVFKVFKSGKVEDLRPLCMTIEESLLFDDEKDTVQNRFDILRNDENLRLEANTMIFSLIDEKFISSRKLLLSKLKTEISGYKISDMYCAFDKKNTRIFGKTILKIVNKYGDIQYLGFQLAEVSKYTWRIYYDIWIPGNIGEEYTKFE